MRANTAGKLQDRSGALGTARHVSPGESGDMSASSRTPNAGAESVCIRPFCHFRFEVRWKPRADVVNARPTGLAADPCEPVDKMEQK